MKLSCDVIRDLLPLYAEDMVSSATRALVEEHLDTCPKCKTDLKEMKGAERYSPDTNTAPLRKVQKKILSKKIYTAILSVLLAMVVVITIIAYLTAPNYLPYSQEIVSVSESDDGTVYLKFSEEVSGYDINKSATEDHSGFKYSLTAWNNTWSNFFSNRGLETVVLNPDQDNVVSIYYYTGEVDSVYDTNDILIYGEDLYRNGGVITLPRLFLAYYVFLAILALGGLAVLYWLFRKNEKVRSILEKAIPLPLAYLVGHLCIKGFATASYSATRDFFAILLTTFPIYGVLLLVIYIYRRQRRSD